jgi:hypothetical protein
VRLICEVNDRMAESFARLPCEGPKAFICECGALACAARVSLTLAEYHTIRADPMRLALAPGHAAEAGGTLERDGRLVVAETAA